ncbi:FkbM family methyltransferase [Caenimonas koreensis DSM 17982]|uniref:FkbM family methyltransferase n=1 Tax=Caenimonas koreensis DSM 17982 TaxID=1121255 RepID=A0A844B0L6_9BURK|nr:FkbM family methyltransferase [Caenimonas koreensis]MRD46832.1 FkbM family methyltransferase [Caenimonas koreensis DSM 17982]
MTAEKRLFRRFIEASRRCFHFVGIDVRKHVPVTSNYPSHAEVFKALVALRYGYQRTGQHDDASRFLDFCSDHLAQSQAQLLQDLFVLYQTGSKREGFFVEFGATDGVSINNTVLLERQYGWRGILAEPARSWREALKQNRTCTISTDCVWHTSGAVLAFNETADKEYSTLAELSTSDYHHRSRAGGERYEVKTVSLVDLLDQSNAPKTIDYLSVDTEGSELDILRAFDFDKYDIRLITVEHNFTPNRELIHDLLSRHGYRRKFEAFSSFDDWYVRDPIA